MSFLLFWFFGQLSVIASVVPLYRSYTKFDELNEVQKRLVTLIVFMFLTEIIANVLWVQSINNNAIFHFYTVVEFFLILRIYALVVPKRLAQVYFWLIFSAFTGFAIYNGMWLQSLYTFNSNVTALSALLVLVIVLHFFYTLLHKDEFQRLDRQPIFWINSGLLIYFSTTLILFFINKNEEFTAANALTIWGIQALVNLVLISFYTVALWIQPKRA